MSVALVSFLRLARSRSAWLTTLGWGTVALASAWVQRSHGSPHGADHALDVYAAVAVPLLVYGVVAAGLAHQGLAASGRSLVRLGATPLRVAGATVLVTMFASALSCGAIGALVVTLGHGALDPPRGLDALETLAFGAIAGATYTAYFMVGAAALGGLWGPRLLLLVDWLVGSGVGLGAVLTPRAHLRNLLGGEAPFDLAPWESLAALVILALVCATAASRWAAKARS